MGNLLEKPGMAGKLPAWWEKKEGEVTPNQGDTGWIPCWSNSFEWENMKNSAMVGKFQYGGIRKITRKNSDIVGNFPHGETKCLPVHENYSIAASWYCQDLHTPFVSVHILAYIPSWGWGCTPSPFHYIYHHVQSCGIRSSSVGRFTHPIFYSTPICILWMKRPLILVLSLYL